jgi:hypothetical protein
MLFRGYMRWKLRIFSDKKLTEKLILKIILTSPQLPGPSTSLRTTPLPLSQWERGRGAGGEEVRLHINRNEVIL